MNISENSVVSIDYTLSDDKGVVLDTTKDDELFSYLHGAGMIIQGLEKSLEGHAKGDTLAVTIEPADGYGEVSHELIQHVPKEHFDSIPNLEVGMELEVSAAEMTHVVTVTEVGENDVTIDGNHPLAGVTLHFDVEVVDIREATAEEIKEGTVLSQ